MTIPILEMRQLRFRRMDRNIARLSLTPWVSDAAPGKDEGLPAQCTLYNPTPLR